MSLGEKLSNVFTRIAVEIETSEQDMGWKDMLVSPLYALAGVTNGTFDLREARVHWSLKDQWRDNIKKQSRAIEAMGTANKKMAQDLDDLGPKVNDWLDSLGMPPDMHVPHASSVGAYLAFELDKLVDDQGMDRRAAMRHLMSMDLTESQHHMRLVQS